MLAAYVEATDIVGFDTLEKMLNEKMGKKKDLLDINKKAFEKGRKLIKEINV
jgi:Pyruvate/2-oxoacid:ferredoxin oxidoreductase gamma subunit